VEERAAIDAAVARLTSAGARTELRAELRVGRRFGPVRRPDAVVPLGRVWRLGVLLLDAEGRLYRTGEVIQAQAVRFDNHQSDRAAARRALRVAMQKAGIAPGETVNLGADPVDAAAVREVSWDGSGDPATFVSLADYLRDRVALLAEPSPGA
jgi:hypothetical protein